MKRKKPTLSDIKRYERFMSALRNDDHRSYLESVSPTGNGGGSAGGSAAAPTRGDTFFQDLIETRDQLVYEFDFKKPDAVKWVAKKFGIGRARVRWILENRENHGMPPDFAVPNSRIEKANARAVTREWMDNHNLTHLLEEESA